MATQRKPAARKPAARKTTKRPARKKAVIAPAVPKVEEPTNHFPPVTEAERQAKLEAYHALKSAGVEVPRELAQEVEGWIAELQASRAQEEAQRAQVEQTRQEQLAEANASGPWYVRNNVNTPFNLRLDRQTEKRRIQLKPRGTSGDLHPLKDEDLKDPILRTNLGLGLIEIIPAGEAALIIDKQTTNMGRREHTPLAMLRNELNQPYAQGAVKVEAEFNRQGVTVATLDPRQMQGQIEDKLVAGRQSWGGLQRVQPGQPVPQQQASDQATSVVSTFVPTGGHPATVTQGGMMGDNARAKAIDDLARRKGAGGLAAGLGDVTVTVDPVVRT